MLLRPQRQREHHRVGFQVRVHPGGFCTPLVGWRACDPHPLDLRRQSLPFCGPLALSTLPSIAAVALKQPLGEFVDHQMQVSEQRAKGLPVVMFVVGIKNQRIRNLALQMPHHRMIFPIFLRYIFRLSSMGSSHGCLFWSSIPELPIALNIGDGHIPSVIPVTQTSRLWNPHLILHLQLFDRLLYLPCDGDIVVPLDLYRRAENDFHAARSWPVCVPVEHFLDTPQTDGHYRHS